MFRPAADRFFSWEGYQVTISSRAQQLAFVRKRMIAALVIIAAVAGGAFFMVSNWESEARQQSDDRTMSNFLSNLTSMSTLDSVYQDQNGDLLADPPENSDLCVTPAELTFAFIAGEDNANDAETWQPALDAIQTRTGVPVKYLRLTDSKDQFQALRNGRLHITAFSSGAVPAAVNTCGFSPICTFGRENGDFGYHMQFIVRADSDLKKLTDLRGRKIAFTRPRSNSGYKAALMQLIKGHQMLPERDYQWSFSYGHVASIHAVAAGEADAAPVASDIFDREVAKGELKAEDFRVIYESEKFPPVAFGCAYNLSPELREGIRAALLGLPWAGTTLEREFGGDESTKFVALTYKDDWANIRRVDEAAATAKRDILGN